MNAETPRDRRWKYPALPFQIRREFERAPADQVEALSQHSVPDIADFVGRMYTVNGISSIFQPALAAIGTAFTVKCPPGDNLGVKIALTMTKPGDVLVVDAQGFTEWCLGGFSMLHLAIKERGLRGLVVYGAYRDALDAQEAGFPIYASAVSAWSGPKLGPAEINVPVSCGGVIVHPGDIVSASAEGVVVIPRLQARRVIDALDEAKARTATGPVFEERMRSLDGAAEIYVSSIFSHGLGEYLD